MSGDNLFKHARECYNRTLIEKLFPGGTWRRDEYYIKSPLREDRHIGSFSINESGLFYDFATGDRGDIIYLVANSRCISNSDAARLIIATAGGRDE